MRKFLVVVDMQNDFITGVLGSKEAQAIVDNVSKKVGDYVQNDDVIVFTKDFHNDKYYLSTLEGKYLPVKHCIYSTKGYDLITELQYFVDHYHNAHVVDKSTFGYREWDYSPEIFGCEHKSKEMQFELVGVCTDICVIANALLLRTYYPESRIIVDSSCCAGSTPEKHEAALEVMKSCHIDVI